MPMESHPLPTPTAQTETSRVTVITDESVGFYIIQKNIKTLEPRGFANRL